MSGINKMTERVVVPTCFRPPKELKMDYRAWYSQTMTLFLGRVKALSEKIIIGLDVAVVTLGHNIVSTARRAGFKTLVNLGMHADACVLQAVAESLASVRPDIVTVSGNAGVEGMRTLKKALPEATCVVAIPVVGTLSDDGIRGLFAELPACDVVEIYIRDAMDAGLDGVFCPPQHISALRGSGYSGVIVTRATLDPSVSNGKSGGCSSRTLTAREAVELGANHVIVHNSIAQSLDSASKLKALLSNLELSLLEREVAA